MSDLAPAPLLHSFHIGSSPLACSTRQEDIVSLKPLYLNKLMATVALNGSGAGHRDDKVVQPPSTPKMSTTTKLPTPLRQSSSFSPQSSSSQYQERTSSPSIRTTTASALNSASDGGQVAAPALHGRVSYGTMASSTRSDATSTQWGENFWITIVDPQVSTQCYPLRFS